MPTRNGKLAHLPNDIREQLNLRLLEGETGEPFGVGAGGMSRKEARELAAWLNALPEVQSVLDARFNGAPISEVNLTHWRQGGYLQWLTERECFDSARALADGDCNLAKTGLSAERLLNVLTVRFGQLLMRWDLPPDETVSAAGAFAEMARKALILQGISRSLLAIHRIQSQSADKKSQPSTTPATSRGNSEGYASPSLPGEAPFDRPRALSKRSASKRLVEAGQEASTATAECVTVDTKKTQCAMETPIPNPFRARRCPGDGHPKILSGPIVPPSPPLHLPHALFKAELDLSEILAAV
jgi:hypothetical protein